MKCAMCGSKELLTVKADIIKLLEGGLRTGLVAQKLGVSRQYVQLLARAINCPSSARPQAIRG
jgi:DNA-binding CsgD family transcriptional regulator